MIEEARHGDFRINIHYSRGGICCEADEMINNGHRCSALATALCLLALMIVEERGVSKLSYYNYSGSVFSVFTLHGLVFHLEMRDIYLMCVCVSKASTPVTDRCLLRILNIQQWEVFHLST